MKLGKVWFGPPASEEGLAVLRKVVPEQVVDDIMPFYQKHDGAERAFEIDWETDRFDCLKIDRISDLADFGGRQAMQECFPGYWVIGSDSGGQWIAYDMHVSCPWPLVLILPGDCEPPSVLARSLTELTVRYFTADK